MKTFQSFGWRKSSTLWICIASIFFSQISSGSALQNIENYAASNSSADDDCPHCNILREMPMEFAEKINDVSDLDVFVHDFVEDTNSLGNVTNTAVHPLRRRRAASGSLRQATCQVVDTVISLVPKDERDPTVFYFPSCVIMKQCGGCCAHSGTTCAPVEDTERQVTIKKTKYTGGSKLVALGDITVTVKEHTKCRCQCKKTASDCNSLQKFVSNQCRCECLNTQEAESCSKEPLKLWDIKSCACVCRDETSCGSGMEYDHKTCSCLPITADDGGEYLDFGQHTENFETFEASDDTKYYHENTKTE